MNHNKFYIILVSAAFIGITVVFLCFPRSTWSDLEKRELSTFPEFSQQKLADNSYTKEISAWFSDSEPYRDRLMLLSMSARDVMRLEVAGADGEVVRVQSAGGAPAAQDQLPVGNGSGEPTDYENNLTAQENAKLAGGSSVIIIGSAPNARALMAYGGTAQGGGEYAAALNEYKRAFPGVNVYSVVIPLASEFYTPDKVKSGTKPQIATLRNINSRLEGVVPVNAYNAMAAHVEEDIYLRTDHHWAPLGAFYVARELARSAGVPFRDLNAYDKRVVRRFVGTMYGYSKDPAIKNSPEDFVYYIPVGVDYSTVYRNYNVDKNFNITGEGKEYKGPFFYKFKDGSGAAYSTFMGSDMKITRVKTGTPGNRKLLVIKDSYGNALPGFMFYSFKEVHVVDFRYFTHNLKKYVADHGITDIAVVVNIFNANSKSTYRKLHRFLVQGEGIPAVAAPKSEVARQPEVSHPAPQKPVHSESKPTVPVEEPVQKTETPDSI